MIKTTVIGNEVKPQEVKFPVLARSKINGTIVLFSKNCCGTVVARGSATTDGRYAIGSYVDCFADISHWEILPNDVQIVLQNDQ